MNTSSPILDPMLVCPDWCDVSRHDHVEELRYLSHSRDVLTLDHLPLSTPSSQVEDTCLYVDVRRNGFGRPVTLALGVGEDIGGAAELTVEQATSVVRALLTAIEIVVEHGPYRPKHRRDLRAVQEMAS